MKYFKFLSTFILLFSLACKQHGAKQNTYTKSSIVQDRMDSLVQNQNIPGLSFSIIHANGQQQTYSAGYADKEAKVSLNENHTMLSGSVGKTYACTILLRLVDEGLVELEDVFFDYFKEEKWLLQLPNMKYITVKMLLQHTSGLPRWVMKPRVWEQLMKDPDKVWSYKDRLSFIFGMDAVHPPGKGWAYSDTNYLLIGMLIERIKNKNYYDLVNEWIIKPYKLKKTYPTIKRKIPNLTQGYSQLPRMFKMPYHMVKDGVFAFNPQMEWTGGGMASSVSDLAKWAKIYYEGMVFSKPLLKKVIQINPNANKVMGETSYGMGSFIFNTSLGKAFGHSGFMPGYNAILAYFPKQKVSISLQINCDYATKKINLMDYVVQLVNLELNSIENKNS